MFGLEALDASLLPALSVALVAGFISFLSPCVLPIVPPYLAYMSGTSLAPGDTPMRRGPVVLAALFFVLGLSTVFIFLGATASFAGQALLQYQEWLTLGAGLVVMLFGLHFLGLVRIGFLNRDVRLDAGDQGGTAFGAYLLGLAFAFGWTPCIGPALGMILSIAATEASLPRGMALLAVYAMGLGLPFLIVAWFLPRMGGTLGFFKRHMAQIERAMGLLLWTVGLLMITGGFAAMSFWLLEAFPIMQHIG